MKTAVVYYSMSGNTAMTAEKLAEALGADCVEIRPEKAYPDRGVKKFLWGGKSAVMAETPKLEPYDFRAEEYDRIVIGFPVWASNIAPPVRTFAQENRDLLKNKKIAAFACQSGNGAEKAFRKLAEVLGRDSVAPTLVLIDPKAKPKAEKEQRIREYIRELLENK